jgi:DNA-binding GntR family transcriptional regulator
MTERDEQSPPSEKNLTAEDLYDDMEVLEPYTAGELAARFDASKKRVRTLLERLSGDGKVRKKEPEPNRAIWVRDAPIHECSDCGYKYEVKFVHPVLSSVRYCPRCGNQL